MTPASTERRALAELERLIRARRDLDPTIRAQWLRVLQHLTPEDRERLRQVLRSGIGGDHGADGASGGASSAR